MLSNRRMALMGGAILVALTTVGFALQQVSQGSVGKRIYLSKTAKLVAPSSTPTSQEIQGAMFGYYTGSLPVGWTADNLGSVEGRDTGIRDAETGERLALVVVRDDIPDVDEAWLYLNGSVAFHATRSNGAVVNKNGKAVASLTVFLPARPYDLEVVWWSSGTGSKQQSVHVGL